LNADSDLRIKMAREAATLLYCGVEKEYKQAKLKAAKTYGAHFLPSNLQVALELDAMAEALEGPLREDRLINMRKEALNIMKKLRAYHPILIGSVWRGTIRQRSDIDISLYHDVPDEVLDILKRNKIKISRTEWITTTKKGKTVTTFHIHSETAHNHTVELVVRSTDEAGQKRKCEIFGDELKGIKSKDLERVLKENPAQKFIPI
jgi:predicted nucleotidyltransferase